MIQINQHPQSQQLCLTPETQAGKYRHPLGCLSGMGCTASHAQPPLWTPSLGRLFAKSSSRARCLPSTTPATPDGHSSQLPACPFPRGCCRPHSLSLPPHLGQVFLTPALPLGFGVQTPPSFRSQGSKFNLLMQKSPGYISSNVFHFPLHRSPHGPATFSVIKLFHTFHLFGAVCQRPFKL